ncbi:MAG: zf-HC2 domain-containing protein [bacterium]
MIHLTVQQLSASLDGALRGPSLDLVTRHLAACHRCRDRQARLARTDDALRRLLASATDEAFLDDLSARSEAWITAIAHGLPEPRPHASAPLSHEEGAGELPPKRVLPGETPAVVDPVAAAGWGRIGVRPTAPTTAPVSDTDAAQRALEESERVAFGTEAPVEDSPSDLTAWLREQARRAAEAGTSQPEPTPEAMPYRPLTADLVQPLHSSPEPTPSYAPPTPDAPADATPRFAVPAEHHPFAPPAWRTPVESAPVSHEHAWTPPATPEPVSHEPAWAPPATPEPVSHATPSATDPLHDANEWPEPIADIVTAPVEASSLAEVVPPRERYVTMPGATPPSTPARTTPGRRPTTASVAALVVVGVLMVVMTVLWVLPPDRTGIAGWGGPREDSTTHTTPPTSQAGTAPAAVPVPVEEVVTPDAPRLPETPETRAATPTPTARWYSVCGVVSAPDGSPIADARLTVESIGLKLHTDAQGHFCLSAPEGAQLVHVEARGYEGTHERLRVSRTSPAMRVSLRPKR